ncbi:hypothetical protein QTP88_012512 [Uroleucon formosanum]
MPYVNVSAAKLAIILLSIGYSVFRLVLKARASKVQSELIDSSAVVMFALSTHNTQINLIIFDDSQNYLQFIRDIQKLFEFHRVITIIKIPAGLIENTITTKIF